MINISLYVNNEKEYQDFLKSMEDENFERTLAIISNEIKQYELYANEERLYCYKSEREDVDAEFETVDRFNSESIINNVEDFEGFVSHFLRLML